ncbi:MAG TPA: glycosyl hydrolase family 39 [Flavisolibacter sp.]|nr:glycosyl hydrolase family 39 [Flavisolibacter sp.]
MPIKNFFFAKKISLVCLLQMLAICLVAQNNLSAKPEAPMTVDINWDSTLMTSKTTATLQVVENPMLRFNSPIHKNTFKALKELGADYVRYVPWFPYPKMAVAELIAPTKTKTFWDLTYLDSTMNEIMNATAGHPVVINFSTTPAWLWKTDSLVAYPDDPYQLTWSYNQGKTLKDTTMKELTGYYSRLFSWYTKGGFTDELGKFHKSDHHYKIQYWEVLNEPDLEHNISPRLYTKMYDAIAGALKKISPETKFIGISLAFVDNVDFFEYFLNRKNHKEGVMVEGISYHHYSTPSFFGQAIDAFQYTCFEKTDAFLVKVRYIENIRKRLAPKSFTMINELGIILQSPAVSSPIPPEYWNLAGAMFAYSYIELMKMNIDVVGESQLVGYPTQFPDVSMMNWENGKPNSRYHVLKLIKENFGPGDKLVYTKMENLSDFWIVLTPTVQAFNTKKGKRILLINRKNKEVYLQLPEHTKGAIATMVNTLTGDNPSVQATLENNSITLKPFEVVVLALKQL